jgi:hypothetical protein
LLVEVDQGETFLTFNKEVVVEQVDLENLQEQLLDHM